MSDHHPVTYREFQTLERAMSDLSDAVTKLEASISAAVTRVAALEAKAADAPTQADLDAVAAATAKVDAIAPDTTTAAEHPAS